jgi:hypothetical protein
VLPTTDCTGEVVAAHLRLLLLTSTNQSSQGSQGSFRSKKCHWRALPVLLIWNGSNVDDWVSSQTQWDSMSWSHGRYCQLWSASMSSTYTLLHHISTCSQSICAWNSWCYRSDTNNWTAFIDWSSWRNLDMLYCRSGCRRLHRVWHGFWPRGVACCSLWLSGAIRRELLDMMITLQGTCHCMHRMDLCTEQTS